jgi:acyl-coenzyme A synthetase/AMP-(fatty) acid ligase
LRLRKETSKRPAEQAGREPAPELANLTVELLQPVQYSKRYAITNVDSLGVIERFTYAEITRETARWAQLLREKGLQPGDRVLIVAGREWGWRCALLGAIHAGGVAVPCPPSLPLREIRTVAEHADASLLVSLRPPPELVELDGRSALTADDLETVDSAHALEQRPQRTDPRDIALILYAWHGLDLSGTMHTHASLLAQADSAEHWLGVDEDERIWATADDGSGPSIWLLLAAWRRAASIVVVDLELDSDAKLELLDRLRPAALWFSDDEYAILGSAAVPPWVDLGSIRRALVDSEETEGASSFATAFGAALVPIFALDELGVLAGWPAGREGNADAHTAKPAPGIQVAVVDENGTELPRGEVGDVAVRGDAPTLFTGYAGREGRSRSAGWFRFGWRGALTADGALRVETRSPREVEPVDATAYLPVPETVEEPRPAEPAVKEDVERDEAEQEAAEVGAQQAAAAAAREADERQRQAAAARPAEEARLLAEQEARERDAAEAEERRRSEQEANEREKSEAEERHRAEERAKTQQELTAAEAKQRAEEEKRRERERQREEKEARARAEQDAKERERSEAEERRRAEEEAKNQAKLAEAEAHQRAEEEKRREKEREREEREARARAEQEAKERERADAEERRRAEEDAKIQAKVAAAEAKQRAKDDKERQKREAEAAKVQAKLDAVEAKRRAEEDEEREKREAKERAEREKAEAEAARVQAKVDAAEAKRRAKDEKEREKREAVERAQREKAEAEAAKVQAKVDAAEAKQRAKDEKEREKREAVERAEREKAEAEAAKVQAKVDAAEAKQRAKEEKRREKDREREEAEARRRAEQEAREAERAERRAAREEKRRLPEAPTPPDGQRRFGRRRREVVEEAEPEHAPDVVARIQQYGMSAASTERPAKRPEQPDDE